MAKKAAVGADWKKHYPTTSQQAEFFLLKFSSAGVEREELMELKEQFSKYDKRHTGELEEDEAMQLLEARGDTHTFKELRAKVSEIDLDKNRNLSFLEWACFVFNKSWVELHSKSVDPAALKAAMERAAKADAEYAAKRAAKEEAEKKAKAAAEEKEQAEAMKGMKEEEKKAYLEEIRRKKEAEAKRLREEEEKKKAALGQKGIKGVTAKFFYAADATKDTTADNAAKIKEEAKRRRETKEKEAQAKKAAEDAEKAAAEAEKARIEKELKAKEAAEAEKKRLAAEAERKKAEEGEGVLKKQQEAYEAQKRAAEEEERRKKEEEAKKREESRLRLKAKATLWS
eukprot:TRINITY_DN21287_c0_g1_i2.p1 TRINITY_DN21287_c0_g1~~TRINITY_DN21287_c0_g1_i2.p1  ORF type:complete len:342 (-),score=112.37 TRINITY_DN21287_c0_g1_i2:100-1125(-)